MGGFATKSLMNTKGHGENEGQIKEINLGLGFLAIEIPFTVIENQDND